MDSRQLDPESHWDGSLWIDKEAELRLRETISSVDNLLFQDISHQSGSPLLICQNIDARAMKEESEEWRDWACFFAIRVLGTHPSSCSISSPCNEYDHEEEIFAADASADSDDSTLEKIKSALFDGLMQSVLSDVTDLNPPLLAPKFDESVSEASTSEIDIMCHVER
jgi:hypothetical protein